MTPEKRRGKILQLIRNNQAITNSAISEHLSVPGETIRTDLITLENDGIVKRLHGRSEIIDSDAALDILIRTGVLTKEERLAEILKMVAEKGTVRVNLLAQIFGVSDATIRNDLSTLEDEGAIRRNHGKAEFIHDTSRSLLLNALISNTGNLPPNAIIERIIENIEEGDVVFLDGSPCAVGVVSVIDPDAGAVILTNSLVTALILEQRRYRSEVYMLPGSLIEKKGTTNLRFFESVVDHFIISKAFLVAASFDARMGFLFEDHESFHLFNELAGRSDEVFVILGGCGVSSRGTFAVPTASLGDRLREVMAGSSISVDEAAKTFPSEVPAVICGDGYVITSPFNHQYVIGFSSLYGSHEFSQTVRQSIEAAAKRHPDIELLLTDNRMDPDITLANIDIFIEQKVDLVIEYQHEYRLGPLIVEKLSNAGIPILAIDIPIPGAVYFGVNNYRAGLLAGHHAAEAVSTRWKGGVDRVIALSDPATGPISENRIAGMLESLRLEIAMPTDTVTRLNTENDTLAAERDMLALLETFDPGERILILAFNDVVCMGALAAIRATGRERQTIAVSHSHIKSISKELGKRDSPLIGSVAFFPEKYGEKIIDLTLKILRKEPVLPSNYTEHQWTTT